MNIHIQFLRTRHAEPLREALRHDGWRLAPAGDAGFHASHPEVRDEAEARDQLGRHGLLTSPAVRIEFSGGRER